MKNTPGKSLIKYYYLIYELYEANKIFAINIELQFDWFHRRHPQPKWFCYLFDFCDECAAWQNFKWKSNHGFDLMECLMTLIYISYICVCSFYEQWVFKSFFVHSSVSKLKIFLTSSSISTSIHFAICSFLFFFYVCGLFFHSV